MYSVVSAPLSGMSAKLTPLSVLYWYTVMGAILSSAPGAVHVSFTCVSPAPASRLLGSAGMPKGVALAASEAGPLPPSFSARIWNAYSSPLVRPVSVWEVVVESLESMERHCGMPNTYTEPASARTSPPSATSFL